MPLSEKEKVMQAGRRAVAKAREQLGNINTHEADLQAKEKPHK
ncbi:hypothetical protein [Halalkalibacter akibai]|nr:hypothetical protein [Halalkalibacter akibai]